MIAAENNTTEKDVERIVHHIINKKGEDIIVIDLRGISSVSDFFIIATGTSNVHLKAIADEVCEKMKKEESSIPWHVEGYDARKWILLDYVNIVVHIFDQETRAYYLLEKLWKDAKIRRIE